MDPALINFAAGLVLLLVGYTTGTLIERSHLKSLVARERRSRNMVVVTFQTVPEDWNVEAVQLVTGSVVVSLDYFKRFLASLRGLIGGRMKSYEPLLDRARREALLRMKEEAHKEGYRAIVNVRLETSRLASGRRDGKGTAGVEMLAFGTAVKLAR